MKRCALAFILTLCACNNRASTSRSSPETTASAPTVVVASAPPATKPPIDALKGRTSTVLLDGDILYAATTAGLVAFKFVAGVSLRELAIQPLPGNAHRLALITQAGRKHILVSLGPDGIAEVDVSNVQEGRLHLLNKVPWDDELRRGCHAAWTVHSSRDGSLWAACGGSGLRQLRRDGQGAFKIGDSVPLKGYTRDVAQVNATTLVAAAGLGGLAFVQVAGAHAVSIEPLAGDVRSVEVHENRVFAALGTAGVMILDVANPLKPRVLSHFVPKMNDMVRSVTVDHSVAYLSCGESGLIAMDFSNLASPGELSRVDPESAVNFAMCQSGRVFVANDAGGILVVDVRDPKRLKLVP